MGDILKRVVEVTTFIRARGLNHGKFASLLHDLECVYEEVP
jgi:hypothetical protein